MIERPGAAPGAREPLVAVVGTGDADDELERIAEAVGAAVAGAGAGLVCGGLGGVMEAACRGARGVGGGRRGPVIGILPGIDAAAANPYVEVAIPTGLGYARNLLVVLTGAAVVAVGGASGTLSEIAHAWQLGRPLCAVRSGGGWAAELAGRSLDGKRLDRIHEARDADEVSAWLGRTL